METNPWNLIKLKQLKIDNDDNTPLTEGSHHIVKVIYEDKKNGTILKGFYKEVDNAKKFPELLAKMSVLASAIKQTFQDNTAQEFLVYDSSKKHISGVFSKAIPNFTPFAYINDPIKTENKELVAPSTATLVKNRIIEILLIRWFLQDDDSHPHNLSLQGDIDFDMFWYEHIFDIKSRPFVRYEKKNYTTSDYENFPCVKYAQMYHWPTFTHPGQNTLPTVPLSESIYKNTLPKVYATPEEFAALASNVEAQEQKFAMCLRILLAWQPQLVRATLHERFGNMPLEYTKLSSETYKKYEEKFPDLFNEETNKDTFVNFAMKFYQKYYDNFYRVVVFYMGCTSNNSGLKMMPTYEEFFRKPSYYKMVQGWVKEKNEIYEHEKRNGSAKKYDLDELKKRYHQIWRDSYALVFRCLIHETLNLLHADFEKNNILFDKISPVILTPANVDITCSKQLFSMFYEIKLDNSNLAKASSSYMLLEFYNKTMKLIKNYYETVLDDLNDGINEDFVEQLETICNDKSHTRIQEALIDLDSSEKFEKIYTHLRQLSKQISFKAHLLSTDKQMRDCNSIQNINFELSDPSIVERFVEYLFHSVDQYSAKKFNEYILQALAEYEKSPTAYGIVSYVCKGRTRSASTKNILDESTLSNSNKLAKILCEGNEAGALNPAIISILTVPMLKTHYLHEISNAVDTKEFDRQITPFVHQALKVAKNNPEFKHIYNLHCINKVYTVIFRYLRELPNENINRIVQDALKLYVANKYNFWDKSREIYIAQTFKNCDDYACALIECIKMGSSTSSSSSCLLGVIIGELQKKSYEEALFESRETYQFIKEIAISKPNSNEILKYYVENFDCAASRQIIETANEPQVGLAV